MPPNSARGVTHRTVLKSLATLAALALLASPALAQGYYKDVPNHHWAAPAVNELSDRGVLLGNPDGTFDGQHQLTRFEMAVILHRLVRVQDERGSAASQGAAPLVDVVEALERLDRLEKNDSELYDLLKEIVTTQTIEVGAMFARIQALEERLATLEGQVESGALQGPPGPPGPQGPAGPPGPAAPTAQPDAPRVLSATTPRIEPARPAAQPAATSRPLPQATPARQEPQPEIHLQPATRELHLQP